MHKVMSVPAGLAVAKDNLTLIHSVTAELNLLLKRYPPLLRRLIHLSPL